MATKIVQKEIKFFSELVNDSDFTANTGSTTATFSDSVTGRCKTEITIDVSVGMNISNFQILYADENTASITETKYKIVKQDATFLTEGISIGSKLALTFDPGTANVDVFTVFLIVDSLTNTELHVTYDGAGSNPFLDITLAQLFASVNSQANPANPFSYTNPGYLAIDPSFTAMEFAYNLVENDSGDKSMTSSLTNTTNVIKVKGVETTVGQPAVSGYATSNNKAWVMTPVADPIVTVELDSKVYNNNALYQLKYGNRYIITHEFTVPYYHDGEDDFLEDPLDTPDIYAGTSSPKYTFQTTFYTDINDPNTGSTIVYDSSKGNGGYLNESFNGDADPYTVSNLTYYNITDSADTDRLGIGQITRVTFDVANSEADFISTQLGVIVHGAVVDSSQYQKSSDIFSDVWTFETLRTGANIGLVDGVLFKNYDITFNSASSISVTVDVEFTTDQNARLEEDQFYLLAMQLRNDSESVVVDSHKAHIKIDYNQYGKNNDIDGLFGVSRFEQIPHSLALETRVEDTIGYTNGQYDIEEGALTLVEFWLDTDKNPVLDQLSFQIGGIDAATGVMNILRDTNIDLSNAVLVGDSWQLTLDSTVGYPLAAGDQFNFKKLTTGNLVGTKQFYTLLVGYRIPWQDWLIFQDADTSFYDVTEPNEGLNQKASRYASTGNYSLRLFINSKVSQNGISTEYVTSSRNIMAYDYDTDDLPLPVTYIASIETFDFADVNIANNIIDNTYTKIVATFTPDTLPTFSESVDFNDVANVWNRFAFGNLSTLKNRAGTWANQIANATDTFANSVPTTFTKGSGSLYSSTASSITALENCGAFHGAYSIDKYDSFTCDGQMYANFSGVFNDNDSIVFTIALFVDGLGIENTLSLVASSGGMSMDINPTYVSGDPTTDIFEFISGAPSVALIYNYGKEDWLVLDTDVAPLGGQDWYLSPLDFSVNRNGSIITADIDWDINGTPFLTTLNYNLNTNAVTQKFLGAQSIGFGFQSQSEGGFQNVSLALPGGDFWGAVRIEPTESGSDNGLFELSTDIEGNSSNLLKQPDDTNPDILSVFGLTSTSITVTAQVNTALVTAGQNYKLSAEIGENSVGDLDLLSTFAWIDTADRTILYVQFNTSLDLGTATTTGLSLTGGGVTISSYNSGGSSDNFLRFDLSGPIAEGSGYTFEYDGTNTIESLDNSLNLAIESIDIYDI